MTSDSTNTSSGGRESTVALEFGRTGSGSVVPSAQLEDEDDGSKTDGEGP